jgi:hypothetical protein
MWQRNEMETTKREKNVMEEMNYLKVQFQQH